MRLGLSACVLGYFFIYLFFFCKASFFMWLSLGPVSQVTQQRKRLQKARRLCFGHHQGRFWFNEPATPNRQICKCNWKRLNWTLTLAVISNVTSSQQKYCAGIWPLVAAVLLLTMWYRNQKRQIPAVPLKVSRITLTKLGLSKLLNNSIDLYAFVIWQKISPSLKSDIWNLNTNCLMIC